MAKKKIARPAAGAPRPADEDAQAEESFEDALAALERVVSELEGGELGLAESLSRYELGVARLRRCQEQLERAERRIELLSGVDAQGNPVTRPFDEHETDSLEQRGASRGARRTAPGGGVDGSARLF